MWGGILFLDSAAYTYRVTGKRVQIARHQTLRSQLYLDWPKEMRSSAAGVTALTAYPDGGVRLDRGRVVTEPLPGL